MSQAVLLSEQDNGSAEDWIIGEAIRDEEGTLIGSTKSALDVFNKYFAPYIKTISLPKSSGNTVVFADGSVVYLGHGNCIDMHYDTNGSKKPNSPGYDRFDFLFCDKNYNKEHMGKNKYFGAYSEVLGLKYGREYAKNLCKNNPLHCSTLLLMDNFEFKKDYPYR